MQKVKECQACGQGFNEDNDAVGRRIPTGRCTEVHEGPILRIAPAGNKHS